ncbi:ethanolamine ammonia-lyase subunit EutB, partial [Gilvimarinus sp. 1_MG-2023]
SKAGDRIAGLAAADEIEREAARTLLSQQTLQHLYDTPLTDAEGRIDSVMRINYDIDMAIFATLRHMTLGQLKDLMLASKGPRIRELGTALT